MRYYNSPYIFDLNSISDMLGKERVLRYVIYKLGE